jgi:hypothetical protein
MCSQHGLHMGYAGGDDDEAAGSGFEGVSSGSPGLLPLLPPRHLKRPRNAPARSGHTLAGLPVSAHAHDTSSANDVGAFLSLEDTAAG